MPASRDVEEDCFWFEKYFWWRNSNFGDEMECDVGTPHVHLEWITASEIKSIHEQLETISSPFCQEIFSLADRMEKKTFLRLDEKLYRHCVNELHPYNVGPQIILDESHVWVEFNLSMITDPSDPLYEDERRELCYYAPITMSYTRDWERTVRDMHKDYLDPIINNTKYQTRKPEGVTDVLKIYTRHQVEFKKSQIGDIVLAPNFQKIPDDLRYYQKSLDQQSEVLRAFYSAFGLSAKIQRLFDLLKGFTVGTITDSDTDSIDLFRMARTLVNETRDEKRCPPDLYMCDLSADESEPYSLTNLCQEICYQFSKVLFDLNNEFDEAVEEYNEAYTALSDYLRSYRDKWKELNDNYYQSNFLNVDIYYRSLSTERVKQQARFDFLSLFGEIGGFLGLLLGASVLTLIEILDFIIVTAYMACAEKRKRNQKQEEQEADPEAV